MKHIGLLISAMNSGGAERVVSHLTHILNRDYHVHLILFEDTYMEYSCAGRIHNLNVPAEKGNVYVKLKLLKQRIQRLKVLIREEKLECVVSFLDTPNFVNLLAKVPGCRKVISIRNYSSLENSRSMIGALTNIAMKLLYKRADCVVPVTKLIEKDFHENYGISLNKLHTIYNPYNFEDMHEKGSVPLKPEEQSFFDSGFVFVNVGRIMYQKAVWHLVKAFSLVHNQHPDARLVIVGEDFTKGKLTKLLDDLNICDCVLLTGRTRNPYQYLQNADCYVLSSLFEGFPNALVEGMACGCAVIAADCKSGPREILFEDVDLNASLDEITEADYGILVPALEPEENWDASVITDGERKLAQAMQMLLHDPEKRNYYAKCAAVRSRTFDYEAAGKEFSCVIEGK